MAVFRCTFRSQILGARVPFNLILPEECKSDTPLVVLLHGLSGNQDDWLHYSHIEKLLSERKMAALLPDGQKSWFCDMKYGGKYATYIAEELLPYVRATFPVTKAREKTFAAGLSMGGYGALKIALRWPERFAACGTMSGAADIFARFKLGDRHDQGVAIWGEDYLNVIPGSLDDTYHLARTLEEKGLPKPWIYQSCGTEDKRLGENHLFREFIKDRGYVYEYYEGPGRHNWDFWNAQIVPTLDFFVRCMEENAKR